MSKENYKKLGNIVDNIHKYESSIKNKLDSIIREAMKVHNIALALHDEYYKKQSEKKAKKVKKKLKRSK